MSTYFRWRPFCGADLIVYALELRAMTDDESYNNLLDLRNQVAKHAREYYSVPVPPLVGRASRDAIVRDTVGISCAVRTTKRWKDEVRHIDSAADFSKMLKEAFDYAKGESEAVVRAKQQGYYVVQGCHTDGSIFLEKHIPSVTPDGHPRRTVYFFQGSLQKLLCHFLTTNYANPEHEFYNEMLYNLLLKTMGHQNVPGVTDPHVLSSHT